MKVLKYPHNLNIKKSSLIMGCFEVIHNGHLELIKEAKCHIDPIVIMLIEDPSLLPKSKTKNATSLDVRLNQLANLGIDYAMIVHMDKKIIMTKGADFVKKIVDISSAKRIIIGKDFKSGFNAKYGSKEIKRDFQNVSIIDFVKIKNIKISTTLIKELLETGDVDEIKKISPTPFQINFNFDRNKITTDITNYSNIHSGIYACYCEVNDIIYWSLLHINLDNKAYIYVPDLRITNRNFSAKIWFQKKIRTIIQSMYDNVTKEDKKNTATYLITL